MSVSADTLKYIESENCDTLAECYDQNKFVSGRSYFYDAYKRAGRFARRDVLVDVYDCERSEGDKSSDDARGHASCRQWGTEGK
ncbi:hypothetical protein EDB19DRAFT_1914794 [Suillus lakei]|nr:hypothetical protein EDB19DRAFT_1914794 [Suillus lakei]